jgi:hypothetical protein
VRGSGDDRTRTGDLSPDKRALCAAELRPPRRSRGWDSNPRSRAHEAREDSRSPTAQVWLAGVEPAISGSRSRRGGQLPYSQRTNENPRRESNPHFRVESPASYPFGPRRHEAPAAGLEPASRDQQSRVLPTRPRRNERRKHPGAEGEGVEPPRPEGPPVFETGYRAGGSPSTSGPGRRRTCTAPGKNRELCRLSYGAEMWPAGLEPAAPRVSGGRSTG